MKKLIILLFCLLLSVCAWAGSTLPRDDSGNGTVIQGPAPDSTLSQFLTVNSTQINMTDRLWWSVKSPVDCKYRLLPTATAVRGSYPAFTITAATPLGKVVHRNSRFVTYSGCDRGELEIN